MDRHGSGSYTPPLCWTLGEKGGVGTEHRPMGTDHRRQSQEGEVNGTHEAARRQTTPLLGSGQVSCWSLGPPRALAAAAGDAVDHFSVAFFRKAALWQKEKEEEARRVKDGWYRALSMVLVVCTTGIAAHAGQVWQLSSGASLVRRRKRKKKKRRTRRWCPLRLLCRGIGPRYLPGTALVCA